MTDTARTTARARALPDRAGLAVVTDDTGHDTGHDDARTVPTDHDAEQAVLGSVLLARDAMARIRDVLTPEDFHKLAHRHIFEAMLAVHRSGTDVDTLTVANALRHDGLLDLCGGPQYLIELQADVPSTSRLLVYAGYVRDARRARHLIWTGAQLANLGYEAAGDPMGAWDQAVDLVRRGQRDAVRGAAPYTPLLGEYITEQWAPPDWVYDGLLQRGHRVILVGKPKEGKSTLIRQQVVYGAFGYHPLMGDSSRAHPLVPLLTRDGQRRQVTAFVCDLENDTATWGAEVRQMALYLSHVSGIPADAFPVSLLATGGNPYDPVNSAADRSDLFARLYEVRPDVVVYGPLYKNEQKSDKWAVEAGKAQALLDEIRGLPWRPAIILEAHTTDNRNQAGSRQWGMWSEVNMLLVKPQHDAMIRDLRPIYTPRGAAYAWWPRVLSRNTPWMPWRAEWPARIDPMDGGPLQYDREPGWDTAHLMGVDTPAAGEPVAPPHPVDDPNTQPF